jgi:malonate transporter and related proteins
MIDTILASLAPVFLVMALGYLAGLTKEVDNRNISSLNALVMDFALPAALFTAMAQAPREAVIDQGRLALVLLMAMLIVFALTYAVQLRWFGSSRQESALLALTARQAQTSDRRGFRSSRRSSTNRRRFRWRSRLRSRRSR